MKVEPRRVLVAEPSPPMREWLVATLRRTERVAQLITVEDGLDLLYHLAERGSFDLVVTAVGLPAIGGDQVLAMARTAGLTTPFVLISPADRARLRALVARTTPAVLIDDPLDSAAIAAAARTLLERPPPSSGPPRWQRAFAAARGRHGSIGGAPLE